MRDVLALPLAAILLALGADHALACQPPRSFYEMGRLINTDWRRARSADGRHTALAAPAIRNDALALIIYRGNEWIKDYAVSDLVTDNEVRRPGLSSGMCRPKGLWFQSLSFNEDSSHFVIETSDHEFIEIDAGSGIVTKREDIPIFPVSLSIVTTGAFESICVKQGSVAGILLTMLTATGSPCECVDQGILSTSRFFADNSCSILLAIGVADTDRRFDWIV